MQFPSASQFVLGTRDEEGPEAYSAYDAHSRATLKKREYGVYRSFLKRVLDVALVLLVSPIVVPTVLVLAVLVAQDGASPFYWDRRVGLGGRKFRMMKLRTMVPQANAKLRSYLAENPEAAAEWARSQKLAKDPRITKFGRLLRKTSLDELPQLWNVLRGDMSIVGPRPMMPAQEKLYPGDEYYLMRPGLTGPWQVSERHTSAFEERAAYDAVYNREMSLATDVKLMVSTVVVVFQGTGC